MLSTLETIKNQHFIEEGNENNVNVYDPIRLTNRETDKAIEEGKSLGSFTNYNISTSKKQEIANIEGVPVNDADIITHEMSHQYDYEIGNQADSQNKRGAKSPTEQRAVKTENRIRRLSKLPIRTTYGKDKIDPKKL